MEKNKNKNVRVILKSFKLLQIENLITTWTPTPDFQDREAEDTAGVFDRDMDQPEDSGSEDELEGKGSVK